MSNITVKFTKMQLEEAQHKLCILRDEPDLQESYEVTAKEAAAVCDTFLKAQPGFVEFPHKFAEVIVGEFDNLLDIAEANLNTDENPMALRAYMGSLKQCMARIKVAAGLE